MAKIGVGAVESFGMVGLSKIAPFFVSLGTLTSYATVSIQKVDVMRAACALGLSVGLSGTSFVIGFCVPARKEMLAVPPPLRVASGWPVETSKTMVSLISWPWMARCRTRFGFLMMSVLIVPALMKLVSRKYQFRIIGYRSWGEGLTCRDFVGFSEYPSCLHPSIETHQRPLRWDY